MAKTQLDVISYAFVPKKVMGNKICDDTVLFCRQCNHPRIRPKKREMATRGGESFVTQKLRARFELALTMYSQPAFANEFFTTETQRH